MNNVGIVYWSGTGNTEMMAKAILSGAKSKGVNAELFSASDFNENKIGEFEAFAFGCPSMGDEELEDSEFIPMWENVKGKLSGKKVGLFGSYGWGDGEWMRLWEDECANDGIDLACDCLILNYTPTDEGLEECQNMGIALAEA